MKPIVLCLFVYLWNISCVYSQQHPCMYACPADKESIKAKIESEAWAYAAFSQVRQKVENMPTDIALTRNGWCLALPCIGRKGNDTRSVT